MVTDFAMQHNSLTINNFTKAMPRFGGTAFVFPPHLSSLTRARLMPPL